MKKIEAVKLLKDKAPKVKIKSVYQLKDGFVFACFDKKDKAESILQPIIVYRDGKIRGLNENYQPDRKMLNRIYGRSTKNV